MLWYEDETYEDCGTDAARLEGGIPSAPQTQCSDAWGKAVGYRFPTKAECDEIAWDLNRKSREEFKCSIERPGETSDDVPSPSAGQP